MKKFPTTKVQLATLLLILINTFSVKANSEPLVLSNTQLDAVSAGYVNLYGNAEANAAGPIALADIHVNATQVQTQDENGVIYTVSSILAQATAIGEQVDTSVLVGFETNEGIVSLEVVQTSVSDVISVNLFKPVQINGYGVNQTGTESGGESHRNRRFHRRHHRLRGFGRYRNEIPVIYQNETVRLTLITSQ